MSITKCIDTLNAVRYGLTSIRWNICKQDYLKCKKNSFHFIIGNPPYITYHDLSTEHRIFLKENFGIRQDHFDYCYAFIEAGLRDLADDGKLAYLIPYSVIRNTNIPQTRYN